MSSHYLNTAECSAGQLGPLIWPAVSGIYTWHIQDCEWRLENQKSSLPSSTLSNELISAASVQYVGVMYAGMTCRSPQRKTGHLDTIKSIYFCQGLIQVDVVSWCWRLLLRKVRPWLFVNTQFPVTWGHSLAGGTCAGCCRQEMTC